MFSNSDDIFSDNIYAVDFAGYQLTLPHRDQKSDIKAITLPEGITDC